MGAVSVKGGLTIEPNCPLPRLIFCEARCCMLYSVTLHNLRFEFELHHRHGLLHTRHHDRLRRPVPRLWKCFTGSSPDLARQFPTGAMYPKPSSICDRRQARDRRTTVVMRAAWPRQAPIQETSWFPGDGQAWLMHENSMTLSRRGPRSPSPCGHDDWEDGQMPNHLKLQHRVKPLSHR